MRYLGILAGIILFVLAAVAPAQADSTSTIGEWVTICSFSHTNTDDPIVFPGVQNATHLHNFWGSTTTDYASTYASMRASTTTCETPGDKAGYWAPAVLNNGVPVTPAGLPPNGSSSSEAARFSVYYENDLSGLPASAIHNIPKDFQMIAGNSHATSISENPELGSELYWSCSNNTPDIKSKVPINCTTGIDSLHIGFGNCWDGVMRPGPESVVYPVSSSSGYVCPADHNVPITRIIEQIEYPVGTDSSGVTLSSGPTYTAHGDFWNTWVQKKLNTLTSRCIRGDVNCGENPTA